MPAATKAAGTSQRRLKRSPVVLLSRLSAFLTSSTTDSTPAGEISPEAASSTTSKTSLSASSSALVSLPSSSTEPVRWLTTTFRTDELALSLWRTASICFGERQPRDTRARTLPSERCSSRALTRGSGLTAAISADSASTGSLAGPWAGPHCGAACAVRASGGHSNPGPLVPRFGDQVLRLLVRFSADFLCTIGDVHSYSDDADGHRPQRLREGDADGKASN